LHAACSYQASPDILEALIRAYPAGCSHPNSTGNLPIHQACMWQIPSESLELLLHKYPAGAAVRNQYGSLPLHMAASNQASPENIRLLIDAYPDALHLQNDDGMTPLDLALADQEAVSDAVIALLEGRPAPPELTRRQKAEKYQERAAAIERKLASLQNTGSRRDNDVKVVLAAVRRLADRIPHALYVAGVDPNQLEVALSEASPQSDPDIILLETIRKRGSGVRDRVEDLLGTIVGLEHIKSQVRGLRRSAELSDLRTSLMPSKNLVHLLPPALAQETARPAASAMVFCGNPGTGKTAVARLLAKVYHELGVLRKPKFLEVERMDLVGKDVEQTKLKTKEVLEEAAGGVLLIDEAYTLGMASRRNKVDAGASAMAELVYAMQDNSNNPSFPLIILAGFTLEMQAFLAFQPELRKCFPAVYEFPDYSCAELGQIFGDLAASKGFDVEESLTSSFIAGLLERETTPAWRSERNGRVCEMLLTGVRTQVRKRMRVAQMEGTDDQFDPHLILKEDVENVMKSDFK
jgi:stage V sporulation protein K